MSAQQYYDANRIETRVSLAEQNNTQIAETLKELRNDMKEMRAELRSEIHGGFEKLEAKIDGVREKQERDFRLAFSALIFLGIGFAGLLAHAMKWL